MIPNPLLLLAACSLGEGDATNGGPETDTGPVDTYESTLSEIEATIADHGDTVFAATGVDGISDAESHYWSLCQDQWDRMSSCWDAMSGCGMMGGDNQDAWRGWMNDMWDAMRDHHDTMADCWDAAECHAREADWQGHMAEMFDDMHGMSTSWPDDCHW